jgi:hypothetical protein
MEEELILPLNVCPFLRRPLVGSKFFTKRTVKQGTFGELRPWQTTSSRLFCFIASLIMSPIQCIVTPVPIEIEENLS